MSQNKWSLIMLPYHANFGDKPTALQSRQVDVAKMKITETGTNRQIHLNLCVPSKLG